MKIALVNGERQAAQPSVSGECQSCGRPMIAKCGEQRVWHWAHQGQLMCDRWWENETEWHLNWKGVFPDAWREIVHTAADGTRHIADIKTEHGWVIEFQHSAIKPEERRSRDAFYGRIIWVVDGTRRKRDAAQFERAWIDGRAVGRNGIVRNLFVAESALLREWSSCQGPVLFDFGGSMLGWLLPGRHDDRVYVAQFPRVQMVHVLRTGIAEPGLSFDGLLAELRTNYEAHRRSR